MGRSKRMGYKAVYSNDKKGKEKEVEVEVEYYPCDDCVDLIISNNKTISLSAEEWNKMVDEVRRMRDGD